MARYFEPTAKQEASWKEWVATRPEYIRTVAERFYPWTLYRLKTTNHCVTIQSFEGDSEEQTVTLTVAVTGRFNQIIYERYVFGINPDDLEECDLPDPSEPLGAMMIQDDATLH